MAKAAKIPDEDEVRKLPHYVRMAFAARCARLVLPFYEAFVPRDNRVRGAVEYAEHWASNPHDLNLDFLVYAEHAKNAADQLIGGDAASEDARTAARIAALAAARAATTVDPEFSVAIVVDVANYAVRAARILRKDLIPQIYREFHGLLATAVCKRWTKTTTVSANLFDTEMPTTNDELINLIRRAHMVEAERLQTELRQYRAQSQFAELEIFIDPGNASEETLRELLIALSDLHVAAGGMGLHYSAEGRHIYVAEAVSV